MLLQFENLISIIVFMLIIWAGMFFFVDTQVATDAAGFMLCIQRVELLIKTFIRAFAGIDSCAHHRLSKGAHGRTPKN